ncbi:MAG: hypothetical protein AABY03_02255 [Nanoarchaeota archaeon]
MPPTIEVSNEALERLDELKIPYSRKFEKSQDKFVYIPPANLHFAKQKTHFGKYWNETHQALQEEELAMPTLPEFAQTLNYLRENPTDENTELYNEITQVKSPWRATWLDACFEKRKDGLYILTGNKTKSEKLDADTLMEDKRISLESWIAKPTSQGLPRKDVDKSDLYFWYPREGSVARFNASDDGADLNCDGDPVNRNSDIGVHAVRRE